MKRTRGARGKIHHLRIGIERGRIIHREPVNVRTYEEIRMLREAHSIRFMETSEALRGHDPVIGDDLRDRADDPGQNDASACRSGENIIEAVMKATEALRGISRDAFG